MAAAGHDRRALGRDPDLFGVAAQLAQRLPLGSGLLGAPLGAGRLAGLVLAPKPAEVQAAVGHDGDQGEPGRGERDERQPDDQGVLKVDEEVVHSRLGKQDQHLER